MQRNQPWSRLALTVALGTTMALSAGACRSTGDGATGLTAPRQPAGPPPAAPAPAPPSEEASATAETAPASSAVSAPAEPAPPPLPGPEPREPYHELVASLSGKPLPFVSDNLISNEESYLHVAEQLQRLVPEGRAYIGVGPEQTFTYVALTRPAIAFVVDIRRGNLLQHLVFKAMFAKADNRGCFVRLMLGKPCDPDTEPGPDAGIEQVLAHGEAGPPSEETCDQVHQDLMDHVRSEIRVDVSAEDRRWLQEAHHAFCDQGLDMSYQLHVKTRPRFPSFRDVLTATTLDGKHLSFLASADAYRFVRRMQAAGRIVPVVGDLSGKHALAGIARYLEKAQIPLGLLYTSNVEEYLLYEKSGRRWRRWIDNVAALPTDEDSILLRSYMSQSQRHPRHVDGFLSVHVMQRIGTYLEREQKRYSKFWWKVATRDLIEPE